VTGPQFLLTEPDFYATYLVSAWLARASDDTGPGQVLIRDRLASPGLYGARWEFHRAHAGEHQLPGSAWQELGRLYPALGETEREMIRSIGVPGLPEPRGKIQFIGRDINSPTTRRWLEGQCEPGRKPFFYISLERILAPWWIEISHGRIANAHSAVLPFARGTYAMEQIAAAGNADHFIRSAGATIHYVDDGVDTGPIIRAERLQDPFNFRTIWDCKAHSLLLAFDLLVGLATDMRARPGSIPVGLAVHPGDAREYRRAGFTDGLRAAAETNYLAFKRAAGHPG
jgi:phosphoribosylglycinamide formyltransferase 1